MALYFQDRPRVAFFALVILATLAASLLVSVGDVFARGAVLTFEGAPNTSQRNHWLEDGFSVDSTNGFRIINAYGTDGGNNEALLKDGQNMTITLDGGGLFDAIGFKVELHKNKEIGQQQRDALWNASVTSNMGGVMDITSTGNFSLTGPDWEDISELTFNAPGPVCSCTPREVMSISVDDIELSTSVGDIVAEIDIKPGTGTNTLNLNGNGVVPVGVFGSGAFNVADINVSSVVAGVDADSDGEIDVSALPAAVVHGGHIEDIDGDGINDIVFHFREFELGIDTATPGNEILDVMLVGELNDTTAFAGVDVVRITPNNQGSRGKGGMGPK